MARYRIYLLRPNGSIANGMDANYDDDKEARKLAQRLLAGTAQAEIWCGTRSLGQVTSASAQDVIDQGKEWLEKLL